MNIDFITDKLISPADLPGLSEKIDDDVIWTNGCFDIIHTGHIYYLNACKNLGGQLIVGINDDDSVSRLKGPDRPINHINDRIAHLAAFFFVDFIVVFGEDTPMNQIMALKPDVLVKGGDYMVEDIVGYKEVTAYGGRVLTIPLVEGKSTSSLIQKIRSGYV